LKYTVLVTERCTDRALSTESMVIGTAAIILCGFEENGDFYENEVIAVYEMKY